MPCVKIILKDIVHTWLKILIKILFLVNIDKEMCFELFIEEKDIGIIRNKCRRVEL